MLLDGIDEGARNQQIAILGLVVGLVQDGFFTSNFFVTASTPRLSLKATQSSACVVCLPPPHLLSWA
jgi:hypothetical protein